MKRIILLIFFLISSCSNIFSAELRLTLRNQELLPLKIPEFHSICQEIFQYECKRLDFNVDLTVSIVLQNPNPEKFSGEALPDSSRINIYLDSSFTKIKLMAVFAHELAHIMHFRWIKPTNGAIRYFDEGFACWLAGEYYLKWVQKKNFISAVKSINKEERFDINNKINDKLLPCRQREIMYIEWGSFVESLINRYGLKRIYNFYQYLSPITINQQKSSLKLSNEEMKELQESLTKAPKEHIGKESKSKEWFEDLSPKVYKRYKEMRNEQFKAAYLEIFGISFDELKNNWLKLIDI